MTLEAKPPKTTAPEIKTVEMSEVDGVSAGLSIRKHAIIGLLALALLIGGVGGWAVTAELAGAVVASGLLVVESDVKKVQHPTGGVIGELLVRDGSRVEGGDVLVRLDETVTRSNLAIVVKSLNELNVRKARLEAERDDADRVVFPSHLTALTEDPEIGDLMTGEARLFELRRSARQGQKAQLQERIGQLDEEIAGLTGQSNSKRREITFIHLSCCRFDGHRDWVFHEAGGGSCSDGSLAGSLRSRRSGW